MPRADSLSAAISKHTAAEIELIPSSRGVFEVYRDGQLIFSKKALGRFPDESEILALLDE